MKKIIALILALMIVGPAYAISTPQPIIVKVLTPNTIDSVNVPVRISDLTHPCTVTINTNSHGEVSYDWNNAPCSPKGEYGDEFEIEVKGIVKKATLQEYGIDIIVFDFHEPDDCPACPECVCPDCVCDCEDCPNCECPDCLCPECKVCNCPTCPICECPICPECPEKGNLFYALSVLVAAIMGGGAVKIYKARSGEVKVHHRHKGIRDYHSIHITHRNPNIRHPKGELNPVYKNGIYVPVDDR